MVGGPKQRGSWCQPLESMEFAFRFVSDFVQFFIDSLLQVPLSITFGTAVIVTFIWLFNEIASQLMIWRALLVTVWGIIGLDNVYPIRTMGAVEIWLVVLAIGFTAMLLARLTRRKRIRPICPACGTELGPQKS